MSYELPRNIVELIDRELSSVSIKSSRSATKSTTELYKTGDSSQLRNLSIEEQLSYLATRMPATFAANLRVFEILKEEISSLSPTSILDLGAGSGSGTLASLLSFPSIQKTLLIEREKHFLKLADRFIKDSSPQVLVNTIAGDITQTKNTKADLVLVSYALNEISEEHFTEFINSAWNATSSLLVIIEPGTKKGFANIIKARTQLMTLGGHVVAPCPHSLPCPLSGDNWCHFRVRFNRSKLHREVKDASLNYEEEPFSFIAFSKESLVQPIGDRIIGFPRKEKGFTTFDLCTQSGTRQNLKILKRNKESYNSSKKLTWGDKLNLG